MKAVLHLADVYVSKDFDGGNNTKFTPNQNNQDYGTLRFGVSYKRYINKEESKFENFKVAWRGVKADSPVIGLLNAKGVRVALHGELSQEEYNNNKYLQIQCEGRNAITITHYGEKVEEASQPESEPAL